MTSGPQAIRAAILSAIHEERNRQESLVGRKFPWTCANPGISDSAKYAVLSEEQGEVAREVVEALIDPSRRDLEKLATELVQTAAVCVAWLEAIAHEKAQD